ncbi:hypothetical protein KKF82_04285, partial [Patescibacteria group bacterium]|nr:hypothetical protein [Patescibacteria group bacterium]
MANRMLRLACTTLLLLSLLAVINTAVAAGEVSVVPSTLTVSPGGTFTVNINADSGSSNLQAASIELNYDANVLNASSVTAGNLLGTGILIEPGSGITQGKVKYGIARTTASNPAAPANGTFITVEFQVKSSAQAGTSMLDLVAVNLKSSATITIPSPQMKDGQVTVTGQGTTSSSTSTPSSSSATPASTPSSTAAQKPTDTDNNNNTAKSNQTSSAADQPAENEPINTTSG